MKLAELIKKLTPAEQKSLEKSLQGNNRTVLVHDHSFSTDYVRFGYFSDPHIGNRAFNKPLWEQMVAYFKREKIRTIYSPGDIVDGMSGRPGNVYELEAIGFKAQVKLACHYINTLSFAKVHSIGGNHDLFFKDKTNVDASVGEAIADRCKHFSYLGDWEADVVLGKGVTMKLFHANDGTAYATSYKIQKLIESLESGKKPQIICSGHYHKQLAMFSRGIFAFECGTLCGQTQWMRGKKIAAHQGFGIIEIWIGKMGGVERLRHEFIPFY
jgi:predicted phosphodiesterase